MCSPPASRCFSPTKGSRTNPSGASPAKQNAWIPQARCRISNEPKRRRPVHSVGRKLQFPSSPHMAVPSTAANAFSSGGRWVRQPEPPFAAAVAAAQGKPSTAGPGLFRGEAKSCPSEKSEPSRNSRPRCIDRAQQVTRSLFSLCPLPGTNRSDDSFTVFRMGRIPRSDET